jgi:hypothetical protein
MNKSCEKKQQQHIIKIFYMWMFCIALKGRNTKRFVQNWHSPSHILYSFARKNRGSYPQFIALEASTLTITLPMRFPIFI